MIQRLKPQVRLFSSSSSCKAMQSFTTTEQSTNEHINSLCLQKRNREAIQVFDFIAKNKTTFKLRPTTYARLICACSSIRSLVNAKKVHAHLLTEANFRTDIVLNNHVLNMFGRCGSVSDALKVFEKMPERNIVSWTSIISGFCSNGKERLAVEFYSRMRRVGIFPDEFAFGSVIKACAAIGDHRLGRQIHAQQVVARSEINGGDRIYVIAENALVAMYAKFGRIEEAYNVFSGISERDLISWGSMIAGFSQLGYEIEALREFKEMLCRSDFRPNEFIFGSVFSACRGLVEPGLIGRQVHGMCVKSGLDGDVFAGCSLCDMYAKIGLFDSARLTFARIDCPDLVSWNAIVSGLSSEDPEEAVSFFVRMRRDSSGIRPNDVTFLSLLSACENHSKIGLGRQIHSCVIKSGFDSKIPLCNALLSMYAKCSSSLSEAFQVFECLGNNADLVSWNAILTACDHHNESEDTFRLFKLMLLSRFRPDHVSISNLVSACAAMASLEIGDQVHSFATKTGLSTKTYVANSLIDMYTKCGALESARRLFDLMESPDVVSWTSLIVGYAQFGRGDRREALELFSEMKHSEVKPNEVTLVGVLTACSHAGLVEEGQKIFDTMESEHGIAPTREHCSCMVDLLGRSGHLREAEDFIKKMAFEPDAVVWKTLLSASRASGDVEIGKRAAENVVKLDPSDSSAIVLLSGIYASSGNWDEVARLRSLMREKGVRKKVPGQSWIEIKGRTHAFLAEDTCHPERDRVYEALEELWLSIMPNEGFDLLLEQQ